MATKAFDLVVIGTGTAASTVASRCRSAGWRVAIVDSRPFGGTCALRGCDPKKVLVGAAEVIDWTQRMNGKGLRAEQLKIAWPELMRFKQSFTAPVPKQREESFSKAGIAACHGRARFCRLHGRSGRRGSAGGPTRGGGHGGEAGEFTHPRRGASHHKRSILGAYRAASAHCVYWRRVHFFRVRAHRCARRRQTSRFSIVALVPSRVLILILSTNWCNGHGNSALTFSFRRN